jgi:hypothetical protein
MIIYAYTAVTLAMHSMTVFALSNYTCCAVALASHTIANAIIVNSIYVWHMSASPPTTSNNKQFFS